jgi:hypothetical protein
MAYRIAAGYPNAQDLEAMRNQGISQELAQNSVRMHIAAANVNVAPGTSSGIRGVVPFVPASQTKEPTQL